MSKAVRFVEEIQPIHSRFTSWHPFHMDLSGNTPPCYPEFMYLMDCINSKETSDCYKYYWRLINCLRKQGFDYRD